MTFKLFDHSTGTAYCMSSLTQTRLKLFRNVFNNISEPSVFPDYTLFDTWTDLRTGTG
jgi:hypothetical protein